MTLGHQAGYGETDHVLLAEHRLADVGGQTAEHLGKPGCLLRRHLVHGVVSPRHQGFIVSLVPPQFTVTASWKP